MSTVRLSSKDRKALAGMLAERSQIACVMINKVGARADSMRTAEGGTSWSIDRSDLWEAIIVSDERLTDEEITLIDGIRFWFSNVSPKSLPALELLVVDGQLHVRSAT